MLKMSFVQAEKQVTTFPLFNLTTKAMGSNKKVWEASSKTASTTQKLLPNTTLQLQKMLAEKATGKLDIMLFKGSEAD